MNRIKLSIAAGLIVAVAQSTGCGKKERIYVKIAPTDVKEIEGSYVKKVEVLTDLAMTRTGVEFSEVTKRLGPRKETPQLSIPYSALLYDPEGKEWVYTNPEHRDFVRAKVKVDYIEGIEGPEGRAMVAFLKEGPEVGTKIVSVGAIELYGAEKKIGHIDAYIRKVQGAK